jgi:hypothetical protein
MSIDKFLDNVLCPVIGLLVLGAVIWTAIN